MQKRKNIISRSIVAATVLTVSALSANAAGLFNFNNLGTGDEVRTTLLNNNSGARNFELKCGENGKTDSTMMKKGKDGNCGNKANTDSNKMKKGKDGKCGEGKCGGAKKGM